MIVALVTDLFFATKIEGAAKPAEVRVNVVRTITDLLADIQDARAAIIDLTLDDPDPVEAIRALRAARTDLTIVGFYPHVQTALAQAATEAGANEVTPRSRFSSQMPRLLRQWAGAPSNE